MTTVIGKKEDRRALRTRQSLRQALVDTIKEKGFPRSSIQDIADRANVNRGTFYIHYEDKYQLLDEIIRERFRGQLIEAIPDEPRWEPDHLRPLVHAVLDCMESKYRHRQPSVRFPSGLVDHAIREELTRLLKEMMEKSGAGTAGDSLVIAAAAAGWAIFGTASQWSREPLTLSADLVAEEIVSLIAGGAAT